MRKLQDCQGPRANVKQATPGSTEAGHLFFSSACWSKWQRKGPPRPFESRNAFPSRRPKSSSKSPWRCSSTRNTNKRKTSHPRCRQFRQGGSPYRAQYVDHLVCCSVEHNKQNYMVRSPLGASPATEREGRERKKEKGAQVPLGTVRSTYQLQAGRPNK